MPSRVPDIVRLTRSSVALERDPEQPVPDDA